MWELIVSLDWLRLLNTAATCGLAVAAFMALRTWKHQDKARKRADFLDELTDTVHEYIQAASKANEHLRFVRIGFESHRNSIDAPDDTLEQGAIAYIEKVGDSESRRLWEALDPCMKLAAQVNALVARGQIYDLTSYDTCRKTTAMLVWQQERIQVVASMLGGKSLNWENPVVQDSLTKMLSVEPESVSGYLVDNNSGFLKFIHEKYEEVYPGT